MKEGFREIEELCSGTADASMSEDSLYLPLGRRMLGLTIVHDHEAFGMLPALATDRWN